MNLMDFHINVTWTENKVILLDPRKYLNCFNSSYQHYKYFDKMNYQAIVAKACQEFKNEKINCSNRFQFSHFV